MGVDKKLIGLRIKQLRKAAQERQRDLAEALDVSEQYISKLERGRTSMSFERVAEIADHYGVDLSALLSNANSGAPDYGKEEICTLMESATPTQKREIIEHAKVVLARYRRSG